MSFGAKRAVWCFLSLALILGLLKAWESNFSDAGAAVGFLVVAGVSLGIGKALNVLNCPSCETLITSGYFRCKNCGASFFGVAGGRRGTLEKGYKAASVVSVVFLAVILGGIGLVWASFRVEALQRFVTVPLFNRFVGLPSLRESFGDLVDVIPQPLATPEAPDAVSTGAEAKNCADLHFTMPAGYRASVVDKKCVLTNEQTQKQVELHRIKITPQTLAKSPFALFARKPDTPHSREFAELMEKDLPAFLLKVFSLSTGSLANDTLFKDVLFDETLLSMKAGFLKIAGGERLASYTIGARRFLRAGPGAGTGAYMYLAEWTPNEVWQVRTNEPPARVHGLLQALALPPVQAQAQPQGVIVPSTPATAPAAH